MPEESKPALYDSHVHTHFCKHALGGMEEYVAQAMLRNLRGIVFTCHNPLPAPMLTNARMEQHQFNDYLRSIESLRSQWSSLLDIRRGLECDYHRDIVPFLDDLLTRQRLDYILGSVHPHLAIHADSFQAEDFEAFARRYFDLIAEAAETGLFDAIAHFDLLKCLQPAEWNVVNLRETIHACLDRIAACGVAVELNTSGYYRPRSEMHPGPEILRAMFDRGIPVVLASDAHTPERVGDLFPMALTLLAEIGYKEISYFVGRRRCTLSIKTAAASLHHRGRAATQNTGL